MKLKTILSYVLVALSFGLGLEITGIFFSANYGSQWWTYPLSFFFNSTMWLSWKFGIQGLNLTVLELSYCFVVGALLGTVHILTRSRKVRFFAFILFLVLFSFLNYLAGEFVARDMRKLGELYGEKLKNDSEFAREFVAGIDDEESKVAVGKFVEAIQNKDDSTTTKDKSGRYETT